MRPCHAYQTVVRRETSTIFTLPRRPNQETSEIHMTLQKKSWAVVWDQRLSHLHSHHAHSLHGIQGRTNTIRHHSLASYGLFLRAEGRAGIIPPRRQKVRKGYRILPVSLRGKSNRIHGMRRTLHSAPLPRRTTLPSEWKEKKAGLSDAINDYLLSHFINSTGPTE